MFTLKRVNICIYYRKWKRPSQNVAVLKIAVCLTPDLIHPNPSKFIRIHHNSSKSIPIHPNPSQFVQIHPNSNKFIPIWIWMNWNKLEWILTKISAGTKSIELQNSFQFISIHPNSSQSIPIHPNSIQFVQKNGFWWVGTNMD